MKLGTNIVLGIALCLALTRPIQARTPVVVAPTPHDDSRTVRALERDVLLMLLEYTGGRDDAAKKEKAKGLKERLAASVKDLAEKLATGNLTPPEEELAKKALAETIKALSSQLELEVISPAPSIRTTPPTAADVASLVDDLRQCTTKPETPTCVATRNAAILAVRALGLPDPLASIRAAVEKLATCATDDDAMCVEARGKVLAEADKLSEHANADFALPLPCSWTQTNAREDIVSPASARFAKVKDVRAYFSEVRTVIAEAESGDHPECAPAMPIPTPSPSPSPSPNAESTKQYRYLQRLSNNALRAVGMRPRFVAVLQPSFTFDKDRKATSPSAMIRFESYRFGDDYRPLAFRLNGAFGLTPAIVTTRKTAEAEALSSTLSVTTSTGPNGTTLTTVVTQKGQLTYPCDLTKEKCAPNPTGQPEFTTSLESALVAHLGFSFGAGLGRGGRAGEIAFFGRSGVTHVGAKSTIAGEGEASSLSVLQLDSPSRDGAFHEAGIRASFFQNSETEPTTLGVLRPMVGLEGGFRRDKRFGSLLPGGLATSKADRDRLFVRLALSRVPVFADKGRVFDLSLVIDHEWARHNSGRVPAVTRIFVQGNFDFLKAIQGGS